MFRYASGGSNKYPFSSVKFLANLVVNTTIITYMPFCSEQKLQQGYPKTSVTSSIEKKKRF